MWLEMIVDGAIVTFSQVGMRLDVYGKDQRCVWASKIEDKARKICGRTDGVRFTCDRGDMTIRLHKDAVKPVIRAISEAELSMPEDIRWFFQRISYLLEHSDEFGVRVADLGRIQ